jgi:asparagine synthase (glutamine-hydrolysing)
MCGIVGLVSDGSGPVDHTLVSRMCGMLEHRGPDDDGFLRDARVGLGMRRLSIIDIEGGHQPVVSEDGSVSAVFNGEIYNFRELRGELEAHGHTFASRSDSETIVHAYEVFGDDFPSHLHGMFSIALWDSRKCRLLLVRDRFGKKPLFYARLGPGLVFSSELKCLLLHPAFKRDVDPQAIDEYLTFGYVRAPRTIFAGAQKVRPGHLLVFENGQIREEPYWSLAPRSAQGELASEARQNAAERLERLVEEAVRKRLVSDVPLGAFLSGGLDSTIVVAMMARLSTGPVKTFTIALDDPRFDEAPVAARTARVFGTEHHELLVRPDLRQDLPAIVWGMDEPQADPSLVPTYYVSQMARQFVTVCLTGDGGDEAFAGYDRYRQAVAELAYDRLPTGLRVASAWIGARLPTGVRGKRRLGRIGASWERRYAAGLTILDAAERSQLYRPEWRRDVATDQAQSRFISLLDSRRHPDVVSALQWLDIHSYLTDDVLAKVDRMSMINSLETRAPLLDHAVVEFAFSLPASAWHRNGTSKALLRDLALRLVPAELLDRPKSGFGIPHARWLRGPLRPLVDEVLLNGGVARRGWLQPRQIERLVREHNSGVVDHGSALWALLCLELWAVQFLDERPFVRRPTSTCIAA